MVQFTEGAGHYILFHLAIRIKIDLQSSVHLWYTLLRSYMGSLPTSPSYSCFGRTTPKIWRWLAEQGRQAGDLYKFRYKVYLSV